MPKVIDTFLFFQELDLVELRFDYLADVVDFFVVVEAAQTFSGNIKPFVFEKYINRYSKYSDKIKYIKIEDTHMSYKSIITHLESRKDNISSKISKLLENHSHYDKKHLPWVLDSYHRECIHYGIENFADSDDLVLLSDLDEFPTVDAISELKKIPPKNFVDFQQKEFRYFTNFYKSDDWLGTIAGKKELIKNVSLNELRVDSKNKRKIFGEPPIFNGGYHFTSVGDIETIRKKIESWTHQEYNNPFTMAELENNVLSGQDIFNRMSGTVTTEVDLSTSALYDDKIRSLLLNYPHLLSKSPINHVNYSIFSHVKRRIRVTVSRINFELRKFFIYFFGRN